jgi:plastocyanin domain-containing protein
MTRPFLLALPVLAALAAPLAARAEQVVQMTVTEDGFVPAQIAAKKGEPLKLVVTRKTNRTCATEIVLKDFGIDQKLPLDKAVVVSFTPKSAGTFRYACGMDMIRGEIVVK